MNSSTINKVFKGAIAGGLFSFSNAAVGLIQFRIILSILGKELAGAWFLFLSLKFFLIFFDFGISPTVAREISFILGRPVLSEEVRSQELADNVATFIRMFRYLGLLAFIVGGGIGLAYLSTVMPAGLMNKVGLAWLLYLVGCVCNLGGELGFASIVGLGEVASEKLLRVGTQIVGLSIAVGFLYLGFGILGLGIAYAIEGSIARFLSWHLFYRFRPELRQIKGRFSMERIKRLILPGVKWTVTNWGSAGIIFKVDSLILASTLGAFAIPNYEAAAKIALSLVTFSLLYTHGLTPFIARSFASNDHDAVESFLLRNVRYTLAFMVLFGTYFAVFGERVVDLWLGPEHYVGNPVLWTMVIIVLLETHHFIHVTAAAATGRTIFIKPALLAIVLNFLFSYGLARSMGIWGVTLGTLLAQLVTNNWMIPYIALRGFKIPIAHYCRSALLPVFSLGAGLLIFNCLALRTLRTFSHFTSLVISFPLCTIFGALMVIVVVLQPGEKDFVKRKFLLGLRHCEE